MFKLISKKITSTKFNIKFYYSVLCIMPFIFLYFFWDHFFLYFDTFCDVLNSNSNMLDILFDIENILTFLFFTVINNFSVEAFILINVLLILITQIKSFFKSSFWTFQKLQKNEMFYFKNSIIIFSISIIIHIYMIKYNVNFYELNFNDNILQIVFRDSINSYPINGLFIQNFSGFLYKILLLFFFIFIFFFYKNGLRSLTKNKNIFIFFILLNFLIFFSFYFMNCYDFFLMFILLIGLNINIYSLLVFEENNKNINEATIKYFIMSSIGTLFILGGVNLVFFFYKTTNFFIIHNILLYDKELQNFEKLSEINNIFFYLNDIYYELNSNIQLDCENLVLDTQLLNNFFRNYNNFIIILFLLIGLTFKLALFPLHSWAIEVYSTIKIRLIAIFILILKFVFFIKTIQIFFFVFQFHIETIYFLKNIISILAILSIIFGCIAALFEDKIKKIIAYSSTNQLGFIFLSISTMLNAEQERYFWYAIEGLQSSLLFILIYLFSNLVLFWILFFDSNKNSIIYLKDIKNIPFFKQLQIYFILLSFSGLPPLAGFFSKFFIFFICWKEKLYFITILAVFTSVFSNFYYLKIIKINLFDESDIILKKNNSQYLKQKNILNEVLNGFIYFILFIITFFFFFFEILLKYSLFLAINTIYII